MVWVWLLLTFRALLFSPQGSVSTRLTCGMSRSGNPWGRILVGETLQQCNLRVKSLCLHPRMKYTVPECTRSFWHQKITALKSLACNKYFEKVYLPHLTTQEQSPPSPGIPTTKKTLILPRWHPGLFSFWNSRIFGFAVSSLRKFQENFPSKNHQQSLHVSLRWSLIISKQAAHLFSPWLG